MAVEAFQKIANNNNDETIRSIAVVGAFKGFENDPECNDYKFVMPSLDYLRRSGFDISDTPDFDAINFEDQRNFLSEDKEYDAVMIAYIRNGRMLGHLRGADLPSEYEEGAHVQSRGTLSTTLDENHTPERYQERLAHSKAKLLLCNGGPYEVILPWINDQSFQTLASPKMSDELMYMHYRAHDASNMERVQGEKIDLPFQWLGIAARPDYLIENQATISAGSTDISRKIDAMSGVPFESLNKKYIIK
ncbi:MAG: hypothetical protein COB76_06505 [Alphaproteobacteria bacterium]|nr:MAG: hypothetical protein COB76_06505 [Alphaproteobacteria bacterium]